MDNDVKPSMEQMIIETSERLFLERGFSGTSTTDIAKEIGCNQALIHYYFRTKENLFGIIFEKKITLFLERLLDVYSGNISFKERIRLIVESHFDLIMDNPKYPQFIINELLSSPKRLSMLKGRLGNKPGKLIQSLQEQIDGEVRKGAIRPVRSIDLLLSMITLNAGVFVFYPIIKEIIGLNEEDVINMLKSRRDENVIMILNSLKPD